MNACSSTKMHGASRNVCSRPEVVGGPTMCVVRCSRAKLVISHARAEPNWSAARKRPMWNHPRQSPTIHPSLSYFPVFSSPTATLEVVGNTGNMSSEKAGVGGSNPFEVSRENMAQVALMGHARPKTQRVKARISQTISDHAVANTWWDPKNLPSWFVLLFGFLQGWMRYWRNRNCHGHRNGRSFPLSTFQVPDGTADRILP